MRLLSATELFRGESGASSNRESSPSTTDLRADRLFTQRSGLHFVSRAEIFPALQRDRHVAILPHEIVEGAEIEFFALLHTGVGEEFHDLQFADLIGDGLARAG